MTAINEPTMMGTGDHGLTLTRKTRNRFWRESCTVFERIANDPAVCVIVLSLTLEKGLAGVGCAYVSFQKLYSTLFPDELNSMTPQCKINTHSLGRRTQDFCALLTCPHLHDFQNAFRVGAPLS